MVNRKINDQYCLDKIQSILGYDLKKLSFSDSNLPYLSESLNSTSVNDDYKLKYLNCFRTSLQIFKLKHTKLRSSKKMDYLRSVSNQNLPTTNPPNESNLSMYKQLTQSDPELYSTNLLSCFQDDETKDKQLFFLKIIYAAFKSLNLLKNSILFKGKLFFTIKPEVRTKYSSNFSDSKNHSNCDSNLCKKPENFDSSKDIKTNDDIRLDDQLNVNSRNDGKHDTKCDQLHNNSRNDLKNEQQNKESCIDRLINFSPNDHEAARKDDSKDASNRNMKSDSKNNEFKFIELKDLDKININKVISCVDLRKKLIDESTNREINQNMNIDASISSLDQDELNRFLNLNDYQSQTIINKIESLKKLSNQITSKEQECEPHLGEKLDQNKLSTNPDASTVRNHMNSLPQMKPIKPLTEPPTDCSTPFFRLNLLDNFLTRSLSNSLPFHLKSSIHTAKDAKKFECKCNCDSLRRQLDGPVRTQQHDNQLAQGKRKEDDIDVIDLNDENNFKFYNENFFSTFDLDFEDQEAIRLEFDKKFARFLREDLERLNAYRSLNDCPDLERRPDGSKKEQFDSIKCLSTFKSKIPVLQRDRNQFSKAMLDKLKIKYDPLKIRNKSKELIDALNEDYMNRMKEHKRSTKSRSDEINYKVKHELTKRLKRHHADTESLRSLKSLKSLRSISSCKSVNSIKSIRIHRPDQTSLQNAKHFELPRPSKIPKFLCDEPSTDEQFLMNRKDALLEMRKSSRKSPKLFNLVKEAAFLKSSKDAKLNGKLLNEKSGQKLSEKTVKPDAKYENMKSEDAKLEYQYLKKCIPRTKSESLINDQLDCNRINENYRQRLLDLELKTSGNCLFQLYDYFDNFKDKKGS